MVLLKYFLIGEYDGNDKLVFSREKYLEMSTSVRVKMWPRSQLESSRYYESA
jgi:hypothetical protein